VPRSALDDLPEVEDFALDFEDGILPELAPCAVARGVESNNVRIAIEYLVR